MTETTLNASVIICAYTEERWEALAAAVASLRRQTRPPREIILVIDHNARLLERARADLPDSIVIENTEPRGLSGARNSGIAVAQGLFIAYLDDDATAEPDWLERLARCCEDPNVLGAGGTVEPLWLEKRPAWFPEEFFWVVGCSYLPRPTDHGGGVGADLSRPIEVRNPFGGCTCYRRELFETVGGFTNGIGRAGGRPLGCEETELCIRAHQRWPQKVFLYEPLARIHHCVPPQRATWRYFRARCYAEGLSKAAVTRSVGAKDGLASERSYTLRILPRGVVRGLADAILRRDPTGFLRAGAIVVGLLTTAAGYVVGTAAQRLRRPVRHDISIDTNTLSRVQNSPD
jgi:glycosyltransferase involved in cell wall biosynthesis